MSLSRRSVLRLGMSAAAASAFAGSNFAAQDRADPAREALGKATKYLRSISTHGGYLWWYSPDLKERAGEGKATVSQIWVQPPGTPAVGMAFLGAFEATGDPEHLDAARAAADALAYGQLESGGWHYMIDFDEKTDRQLRRALAASLPAAQRARRKNITTFDDDNTQSAVRFLMAILQAGGPADQPDRAARIRDALEYALAGMLKAQYPNGAWPQAYMGAPRRPEDHPLIRARVPEQPERIKEYWFHYTLNDHCLRDCILTMLEAHRRFKDDKYLDAARRAGEFLLRAQLPAPQPVWAQQYTFKMEPAWARKFEPPSVSSAESVGVIRTLVDLYLYTGEQQYLKPIPPALEWFEKSKLKDGQWARFYELSTNRPLYFTRDYKLVYTDDDCPTHYSFKGEYGVAAAARQYQAVIAAGRDGWLKEHPIGVHKPGKAASLASRAGEILKAQDDQGRWLERGRVEMRLFIQNMRTLSDFVQASRR